MPNGCEDKLIFGQNRGLCGTFCEQDADGHVITRRSGKKILRSGWTIYTRLASRALSLNFFINLVYFDLETLSVDFETNFLIENQVYRD